MPWGSQSHQHPRAGRRPSGGHGWGLPMPQGAQPAVPPATPEPQHPPRDRESCCPCHPVPPQTPSRDRESHQQCPSCLQNPGIPSPTRAALFRSEYPQYQPARGRDIVSQAGGPGPHCRDKGGCRNPCWGAPGGPPYPRRPAGCAPSPRSAAGGDAPWCAGSSTRLWGEGPGDGVPARSPSPVPRPCAPAPHSQPPTAPQQAPFSPERWGRLPAPQTA